MRSKTLQLSLLLKLELGQLKYKMMKRCDEKHNMPVKLQTVLSMKDVDDAQTRTIKDLPGGITV